LGSRAPKD